MFAIAACLFQPRSHFGGAPDRSPSPNWRRQELSSCTALVFCRANVAAARPDSRRPGRQGRRGRASETGDSVESMSQPNSVLHPDLRGRVAVVTGASRGIGRALAIRLAQEGADVAIGAKSEQSTERLPGSIHETADAIRALGRRALAVPTDVRDEAAIRNLIERTVSELGRVDILVNNAGAIWTQPILQTPPKRFDLMVGVNVRAAYIACYYALPHMVK